jgi:hypothetical protein
LQAEAAEANAGEEGREAAGGSVQLPNGEADTAAAAMKLPVELEGEWPVEHARMWEHVAAVVRRQQDLQAQLAFASLEISVLEKIVSKLRGASGNH